MEGNIGEIRAFGGTFVPEYWMSCSGQQLSIATYSTLFSILGTTYGGDGVNTFKLPDIQSRIVIGAGQGVNLSTYALGQALGEESHTLTYNEMPAHTHVATVQVDQTASSADVALACLTTGTGQPSPQNALLGPEGSGFAVYAAEGSPVTPMNADSVKVNSLMGQVPALTVSSAGLSQGHENRQPVQALTYIICIEGIYPSRN